MVIKARWWKKTNSDNSISLGASGERDGCGQDNCKLVVKHRKKGACFKLWIRQCGPLSYLVTFVFWLVSVGGATVTDPGGVDFLF